MPQAISFVVLTRIPAPDDPRATPAADPYPYPQPAPAGPRTRTRSRTPEPDPEPEPGPGAGARTRTPEPDPEPDPEPEPGAGTRTRTRTRTRNPSRSRNPSRNPDPEPEPVPRITASNDGVAAPPARAYLRRRRCLRPFLHLRPAEDLPPHALNRAPGADHQASPPTVATSGRRDRARVNRAQGTVATIMNVHCSHAVRRSALVAPSQTPSQAGPSPSITRARPCLRSVSRQSPRYRTGQFRSDPTVPRSAGCRGPLRPIHPPMPSSFATSVYERFRASWSWMLLVAITSSAPARSTMPESTSATTAGVPIT